MLHLFVTKKKAEGGLSPQSIFNKWKGVILDEMTRFISILIHMGLVKKPRISDYWSTDPALQTMFASRLMKRDRFKAVLAFLHLNDNAHYVPRQQPQHDPLFKLRPFFSHILQVCLFMKLTACATNFVFL